MRGSGAVAAKLRCALGRVGQGRDPGQATPDERGDAELAFLIAWGSTTQKGQPAGRFVGLAGWARRSEWQSWLG